MRVLSLLTSVILCIACSTETTRNLEPKPSNPDESIDLETKQEEKPNQDLSLGLPGWDDSKFCSPGNANTELPKMKQYFTKDLINSKLEGEGLVGWIHGAAPRFGYYVFTYRSEDENDPMAFFKAEEFSLITKDSEIINSLLSLSRHDKVRLFGKIKEIRSPIRHIEIDQIDVIERFKKSVSYNHKSSLNLRNGETKVLLGKIHTVVADGKALVFEYGDLVLPVFLRPNQYKLTENIYRNDKVLLSVKAVSFPNRPVHLYLDDKISNPIQVIDKIQDCHQKSITLTGVLTRFEKSPQINRNIYALKIVDPNGIERNFTLFPNVDFSDTTTDPNERFIELFNKISDKVDSAWTKELATITHSRNHSYNNKIVLRVKGIMNIISKNQANPQIYIKDAEDIQVSFK